MPQSGGFGWIYEVFTPPAVYYDQRTFSFSVTPTDGASGRGEVPAVELLAVKRELFRLQLAGYCGSPGSWWAIFTNPAGGDAVLARPGQQIDGWDLSFEDFTVRQQVIEEPGANPLAAVARLHDERSGHAVVLKSSEPLHTDRPVAVMRFPSGNGRSREMCEGDTWEDGPVFFRLKKIQLVPPEVLVALEPADGRMAEMITLRPASPAGAHPDRVRGPSPPRPAPSVATNH